MPHVLQPVLALLAVALAAFLGPALAQEPGQTAPPGEGYNVFIIGDALAGGLWAGTTRVGTRYPQFAITGRFKEGSGLARPDIYDWGSAVPKILERRQVDIAIVFIGTNDGQDIRTDSGTVAFGAPEWAGAYAAQVDEIIGGLIDQGVTVYWVGLPPMRAAAHDQAVSAIAAVQRERVLAGGAKYIDIRPAFAAEDGGFVLNGIGIDGNETRLRSLDGITFIKAGNDKLSTLVLDAVSADLGLGEPGAVTAEGGEALAEEGVADLPMFGQELADGSTRTLTASDLSIELAGRDQVQAARVDLDLAADMPAAPDSAAAALFDSGRWPTPKPGRIDDFSWPQ